MSSKWKELEGASVAAHRLRLHRARRDAFKRQRVDEGIEGVRGVEELHPRTIALVAGPEQPPGPESVAGAIAVLATIDACPDQPPPVSASTRAAPPRTRTPSCSWPWLMERAFRQPIPGVRREP